MNRLLIILLFSSILINAGCQNPDYTNLTSVRFHEMIDSGRVTLLDVRTHAEYSHEHIENAGQLNYYSLNFRQKLLLLPKDQPVFLYCNTGYRSERAAEILAKNGYGHVYNLERGIMDWNLHELPTIYDSAAKSIVDIMEPDEFYALINSRENVLIDFYAPWCAPCRTMMPMVDSLQKELKETVTLVKINADASKKLVKELEIGSVPLFVFYNNGKPVFYHSGTTTRETLKKEISKYIE